MNDALLRLILMVIAAITIASGLTQMVAPGFVLGIIGGEALPSTNHAFATVGMFMFITGAMFLQSLWKRSTEPAIPLWIGVQKFAAFVLVSWGVYKGLFGVLAMAVALFDMVTALLTWLYLKRNAQ